MVMGKKKKRNKTTSRANKKSNSTSHLQRNRLHITPHDARIPTNVSTWTEAQQLFNEALLCPQEPAVPGDVVFLS